MSPIWKSLARPQQKVVLLSPCTEIGPRNPGIRCQVVRSGGRSKSDFWRPKSSYETRVLSFSTPQKALSERSKHEDGESDTGSLSQRPASRHIDDTNSVRRINRDLDLKTKESTKPKDFRRQNRLNQLHDDATAASDSDMSPVRTVKAAPGDLPDISTFAYPASENPDVSLGRTKRHAAEAKWLGVTTQQLREMKRKYKARLAKKKGTEADEDGSSAPFDEADAIKMLQDLARHLPRSDIAKQKAKEATRLTAGEKARVKAQRTAILEGTAFEKWKRLQSEERAKGG